MSGIEKVDTTTPVVATQEQEKNTSAKGNVHFSMCLGAITIILVLLIAMSSIGIAAFNYNKAYSDAHPQQYQFTIVMLVGSIIWLLGNATYLVLV